MKRKHNKIDEMRNLVEMFVWREKTEWQMSLVARRGSTRQISILQFYFHQFNTNVSISSSWLFLLLTTRSLSIFEWNYIKNLLNINTCLLVVCSITWSDWCARVCVCVRACVIHTVYTIYMYVSIASPHSYSLGSLSHSFMAHEFVAVVSLKK